MKCLACNATLQPDGKWGNRTVNGKVVEVVQDRLIQIGDNYTCPQCGEIGRFNEALDLVPLDEDQLTNLIIRCPEAAEKLIKVKESIIRKKRTR